MTRPRPSLHLVSTTPEPSWAEGVCRALCGRADGMPGVLAVELAGGQVLGRMRLLYVRAAFGGRGVMAGFTKGPWLMAAKPSSVVGWPVVAPQAMGRVVCSLNYADPKAFGGRGPGDGEFNAESEANARLIAAAPELYAALEMQGRAEIANANCPECQETGEDWSHCEPCSELFGAAIDARHAALAKARGETP